jgi:hypothetical protein
MTLKAPGYTGGGNVTNCKSMVRTTASERLHQRSRRYFTKLLMGMVDEETFYIVLTNAQDRNLQLRSVAWHYVLTRLHQDWDTCEAATVYEYRPRRGSHLNVLIKGTPGLTREYMEHLVGLVQDGTKVGSFEPVSNPRKIASYLTKQLRDTVVMQGWPRNFRPVTTTRNWYPGWMTKKEWRAKHKAERAERRRLVDTTTGEIRS